MISGVNMSRLGFIIDFLSKATLTGFMAGAAIVVSLQQLKSLLGITHFTKQMGLVPVLSSVFHNIKEVLYFTQQSALIFSCKCHINGNCLQPTAACHNVCFITWKHIKFLFS